jgi:hypothetical protein
MTLVDDGEEHQAGKEKSGGRDTSAYKTALGKKDDPVEFTSR